MAWPHAHDFQDAVLNPEASFQDDDLRTAQVVKYPTGLPIPASGQFGIVYQMVAKSGKRWALKCFTADIPGRHERYKQISAHLQEAKLPFMVGFKYLEEGVFIGGAWYPVLKMDWVAGQTLNRFVREHVDQPHVLKYLTDIWMKVAHRLRDKQVTHADLQHGNIMLVPGKQEGWISLKLVDYDGMYLPVLAGTQSGELGHPGYQHPRRLSQGLYGPDVDRFSHLVIYTALRALQVLGEDLWHAHDHGDNLVFSQSDFRCPRDSKVLYELWHDAPADIRALAGRLVLASASPLEAIPHLDQVISGTEVAPLDPRQVRKVNRLLAGEGAAAPAVPVSDGEAEPSEADRFEESLLDLLREYNADNKFYIAPEIPAKKLANACRSCRIPADKRVLGLIDCTLFGSATNCVAFTSDTLYYHNSTKGDCQPNPAAIPYETLPERTLQNYWVYCIAVGGGDYFTLSSSGVQRAIVLSLLEALRDRVAQRRAQAGHVETAPDVMATAPAIPVEPTPRGESVNPAGPVEPAPPPKKREADPAFIEALLAILREANGQNRFHVDPNIPSHKLVRATEACQVPAGQRVLGLIDCTAYGTAADCVLFTTDAVYYHNTVANSCHPNPGVLAYKDFGERTFEYYWQFCLSLGAGEFFSLSGSQVPRATVLRMLNAMKEISCRSVAVSRETATELSTH